MKFAQFKHYLEEITSFVNASQFEQSSGIYFKEAFVIGKNPNGKVYCTEVNINSDGQIVIQLLFNIAPALNDSYDYEQNFTYAILGIDGPEFGAGNDGIQFPDEYTDVFELVISYLHNNGIKWVLEQKQLRVRSRFFHRRALQTSKYITANKPVPTELRLTWAEQLEWKRIGLVIDKLMYNRVCLNDHNEYNKMMELGEEKYTALQKHNNRKIRRMMRGMMASIHKMKKSK